MITITWPFIILKYFRVGEDVVAKKPEEEKEKRQQIKDQDTTWYHEGPPSLLDARLFVAGMEVILSKFKKINVKMQNYSIILV